MQAVCGSANQVNLRVVATSDHQLWRGIAVERPVRQSELLLAPGMKWSRALLTYFLEMSSAFTARRFVAIHPAETDCAAARFRLH